MSFKKWSIALLLLVGLCPMVFGWECQNGFSICTANGNQFTPKITSDGMGGAIITWVDYRNGTDYDIYAQGIDNEGVVRWVDDGILIAGGTGFQDLPQIVMDNNNGAYIMWMDNDDGFKSYLQRVNWIGDLQYPTPMYICSSDAPYIVEDGVGGAFIVWSSGFMEGDIYMQALSWENNLLYGENGVAICTTEGNQSFPRIVADGEGGSIIVWMDERRGSEIRDIYAQAVDGSGAVRWTLDGVAIATTVNDQSEPKIVADGQGGAIMCWQSKAGSYTKIMAQAIDSTGQVKWTENGISVCSTDNYQSFPTIVSDGLGGAIIAWEDNRNSSVDIYAQAIDSTGTLRWGMTGVSICTAIHSQCCIQIISDGANGAILSWLDSRSTGAGIYTQAVSNMGIVKWAQDGIALSTNGYGDSPTMTSDGAGGAIIAWNDSRNSNYDIYAQSVTGVGFVPVELSEFGIE